MEKKETYGRPVTGLGQKIAYGAATAGTAINASCVRVDATTNCFIRFSAAGDAAVADIDVHVLAGVPEYFDIAPRSIPNVIQEASAGNCWIMPIV